GLVTGGATIVDSTSGGCAANRPSVDSILRNGCSTANFGSVVAKFDGTLTTAGSLTMETDVHAASLTKGRSVSVGLGGSITGSTMHAVTVPSVTTRVAGPVNVTGGATIKSVASTDANSTGNAFSVG